MLILSDIGMDKTSSWLTKLSNIYPNAFPNIWFDKLFRRRNGKFVISKNIILKMESLRFRPLLLSHVEDSSSQPTKFASVPR